MKFNYEIELTCSHSTTLQFDFEMNFNDDTEVYCIECKDYHLVQDYININEFNSFVIVMNRK